MECAHEAAICSGDLTCVRCGDVLRSGLTEDEIGGRVNYAPTEVGISRSTCSRLQKACVDFLSELGWTEPVIADSELLDWLYVSPRMRNRSLRLKAAVWTLFHYSHVYSAEEVKKASRVSDKDWRLSIIELAQAGYAVSAEERAVKRSRMSSETYKASMAESSLPRNQNVSTPSLVAKSERRPEVQKKARLVALQLEMHVAICCGGQPKDGSLLQEHRRVRGFSVRNCLACMRQVARLQAEFHLASLEKHIPPAEPDILRPWRRPRRSLLL